MTRVSFTYGALYRVRRAQRRYRCDGHMADPHFIEPGSSYLESDLPPDNSEIGNTTWWRMRFCDDCSPEGVLDADPQGCSACGRLERGHGDVYTPGVGGHQWKQPDDALVKARMLTRREDTPHA